MKYRICSDKIHQGGGVAAPVGGQILSEILPYLELTKDNETEENKKAQVEVPNVEGMTVQEAIKLLKEVNLELQIKDEPENLDKTAVINRQLPKEGISVYEGTKVIVNL